MINDLEQKSQRLTPKEKEEYYTVFALEGEKTTTSKTKDKTSASNDDELTSETSETEEKNTNINKINNKVLRRSERLKTTKKQQNYAPEVSLKVKADILSVPRTFSSIFGRNDEAEWLRAYEKEVKALETVGGMQVVDRKEAGKSKVIPLREIFSRKYDNVLNEEIEKVRICARGDLVKDKNNYFSPVAGADALRFFFCYAVQQNLTVRQADVKTAFLFARGHKEHFFELPNGHRMKDGKKYVYKTKAALYGLKEAPRLWNNTLNKFLTKQGFKRHETQPCLYVKKDKIIVLIYVDDILSASCSDKRLARFEGEIGKAFNVKTSQVLEKFLGLEINVQQNENQMMIKIKGENKITKLVET